ncbi:MAG: putative AlkP superfamily pyrophosphatase or phosphodiesterase [Desulforhopalus sp.]|jgi:predicted AlkP superfamily pyrophosphatase or phosphodiesterase
MKRYFYVVILLFSFLFLIPASALASNSQSPKMIVQITIDGLRGDLPYKYMDRYGSGGFKYFMDEGVVYTNSHYQYSNNETIVGHTTLATGAHPAVHGMIGNLWLDQSTGELSYNIEDPDYEIIGSVSFVDKKTELDPTQRAARTDGRSPRAIRTSTFSDELLLSSNGQAKIFAVSVKDRGAVPLAGHGGKAFWFNKQSGEFISSTFYYDEYPDWVDEWSGKKLADNFTNKHWELSHDAGSYVLKDRDDRPYEIDMRGYGRTFPHPFGDNPKLLYTLLTLSPVGDELTLDFAKTLIKNEQLGTDAITDYLAVSFSSTDYVNHVFGPSSLEMEDNLLRLDRTLADLVGYIDEKIGLKNVVIVLSADHGTPEAPEQMAEIGLDVHRLSPERVKNDNVEERLQKQFGFGKELIQIYSHPYIYLNRSMITEKGLDQMEVERAVAEEVMKIPGIAAAISSRELQQSDYINPMFSTHVKNNYHPLRSGDIYVIQEPYNHLVSDESTPLAAMHGSPWEYDTFVPMMFAGAGIKAGFVERSVHPIDIAKTLSAIMKIKAPSGAVGDVLFEVTEQ